MQQSTSQRPTLKSQVTHLRSQSQQDVNAPQQATNKTNFYTTFNFNVLHSKQSEFQPDNYNDNHSPIKQLKSMHLGGGLQEARWSQSRSLIDTKPSAFDNSKIMQSSGGFEAFKFRPVHGNPISLRQSSLELESTLKLKKFENLMTKPTNPTQMKTSYGQSFKLIPLVQQSKPLSIIHSKVDTRTSYEQFFDHSKSKDSVEKVLFQSTFTDNTTVDQSHFFPQNSSRLTYGFSKELDSKQMSVELTQPLLTKLKQKQTKIDVVQKEWQPPTTIITQGRRKDQIEIQTLRREAQLKRRPKFRACSATQRNKKLEETILGRDFVLNLQKDESSEEYVSARPINPLDEQDDRCFETAPDKKYKKELIDSHRPRLGHLLLRPETRDFQQNLGHTRFEQMLQNANTDDDRKIINSAYNQFMKAIRVQQKQQSIKQASSEATQFEEDSDESLTLEEDGGPRIECQDLASDDKLLGNFVKAISKKLLKYTQKLGRDIENAEYHDRIRDLNITEIQAKFDIPKKLKAKRKPLDGEDLHITALEQIYWKEGKFERLAQVNLQSLKDYTTLLEGTKFDQKLQLKPSKIRRGFINLPGSNTVEIRNLEEIIDDPAVIFDKYLQYKQESSKTLGGDFNQKYETSRLSSSYNYNSIMFEEFPSSKVSFIKCSNSNLELALPILAKIKNKELILSDYRLEIGNLEALKVAFSIEPDLIKKITLNNCGVDDQAMTVLLEGCLLLESICHIQVTKGNFGLRSMELLAQVLQRPQFVSLKLKDVELQPITSDLLFETLGNKNYLQFLSLSGFQFTQKSFELLIEYMQKSQILQELDLGNVSGLRLQNWTKFMQVLARNKTLRDLDLSWNNLIENQDTAFAQLKNPYKLFKQIYAKWIRMGLGAQWPGKDAMLNNIQKPKIVDPKKTNEGGKKCAQIPQFSYADSHDQIFDRYETPDIEENLRQKLIFQVEKLMKQSIRQAFVINFMTPVNVIKGKSLESKPHPPLQMGSEPFEQASQQATIVTEAIYKFIRRNNNIQHLNLTGCNMSQVMIARIGVGIKCSGSLMAVHLSNNPGVTSAVKAFLQVKLKAAPPPSKDTKISNHFLESDSKLRETMTQQLQTLKAKEQSLVHETVAIREINKKKHDSSYHPDDPIMAETKTLLFTRLLGHKFQLPGSGRWLIFTDPKDECWICHKYIYSLIFWNPKQIALQQVPQSHMINKDKITQKLKISKEDGNPVIYAPFTNWHGQKMHSVKEFAEIMRKPTPPDFIEMVKTLHNLPEKFEYFDLTPDHKQMVLELKTEYQSTCTDNWRQHIGGFNRFKDVQFVNYEHLDPQKFTDGIFDDLVTNPIYVYPAMAKPGKQYYIVQQNTFLQEESEPATLRSQDFYLHKAINPIREAPLPQVVKTLVQNEIIRVFDKVRSVFHPWRADSLGSLSKCVDNDILAMNLGKLVKDEDEMTRIVKVVRKNISYIKQCHLDLITTSSTPPYVTFLDFVNFYRTCKLDDENLKPASIDLIYVQVLTNCKTRTCINRGELIEALIRIAKAKYCVTGICATLDEALQKLIEKNIKPTWGDSLWHQTRVQKFWNVEINDILEVNQEALKKIFALWWDLKGIVKKKWLEIKEADYLMTQTMPELKLTINTARQCYVMSKMTCENEQTKIEQHNRLVFVEFLEMLCRIALYHYDETPMRGWDLPQRLMHVVDNVLMIRGIERKEVMIETQVDSDADISDNDY